MDLLPPSFSLLNSFDDSQASTPPDSLPSLLSEAPEIGKWFSSYVYESPELNNGEDVQCTESVQRNDQEEEKKKNDVEKETYKGKEDDLGYFGKDENLDLKGFVRCKNAIANNNFASQASGSTDSCLLISEPPDINNWFSSYAYESPALGSNDDINFSDYQEYIFDIKGNVSEKADRPKKDLKGLRIGRNNDFTDEEMVLGGDKKKSKRCLETNESKHSHKGNNIVDREGVSDSPTEVPFKTPTELVEDIYKTSTNVPEQSSSRELSRTEKSSTCNDELSPNRLIHHRNSTKEGSEENIPNSIIAADGDAMDKASRRHNKENDGNVSAANSFISTRKTSFKRRENSVTNNVGVQSVELLNGGRVSNGGHNKNVMAQRKALSETTNILRVDAIEVPGKWRCPQKSKPNLGPPLKQLRLEQWVRRI